MLPTTETFTPGKAGSAKLLSFGELINQLAANLRKSDTEILVTTSATFAILILAGISIFGQKALDISFNFLPGNLLIIFYVVAMDALCRLIGMHNVTQRAPLRFC